MQVIERKSLHVIIIIDLHVLHVFEPFGTDGMKINIMLIFAGR